MRSNNPSLERPFALHKVEEPDESFDETALPDENSAKLRVIAVALLASLAMIGVLALAHFLGR